MYLCLYVFTHTRCIYIYTHTRVFELCGMWIAPSIAFVVYLGKVKVDSRARVGFWSS